MFEFSYPWIFLLLVFPLILNKSSFYYLSKRSALRISFKEDIDAVNGDNKSTSGISRASFLQKILLGTVYILIVTAMAKPQYIGEPLSKEISQREVLVSVDLSGSMATKDFKELASSS